MFIDNFDDLLRSLNITQARPLLIGIDGRPCSGKSSLADKLAEALKAETIFLDDFFIPEEDWPKDIKPAYPFPYFRDEEFDQGIKILSQGLPFSYSPFDWSTKKPGPKKIINPESIIIVEGVSVLRQELVSSYYKKIVVMSDEQTEFTALREREKQSGLALWEQLYLPCVKIYWQTKPWERADILYAGRGIKNSQ